MSSCVSDKANNSFHNVLVNTLSLSEMRGSGSLCSLYMLLKYG
jgi:hypothetical protein